MSEAARSFMGYAKDWLGGVIRSHFFYQKIASIIGENLPVKIWYSARGVFLLILLSSLVINLLSLAFPLALLQMYDRIIPNAAMNTLVFLVGGVTIALLLETVLRIVRSYVGAWADAKFEHRMGCKAFRQMLHASVVQFEKSKTSAHLKNLIALSSLKDFYAGQVLISFADVPFVFILLALIAYIGNWLVLVPLSILLVFLILTLLHIKHMPKILSQKQRHDDQRFNFIIETLSNIHTVKTETMEAQMLRRYEYLENKTIMDSYKLSHNSSSSMIQNLLMSQVTIILVVAAGSILTIQGYITVGSLAACILLSGRCLAPVNTLISVCKRLQTIKLARRELKQIFDLPGEVVLKKHAELKMEGEIEFRDVTLKQEGDNVNILQNLNFIVPKKQTVSLSGSGFYGKTSLAWVLLGMLQPITGTVLIDGVDIATLNVEALRRQIAYLPQQAVLFNGSIMDNLTLFQVDEYADRAMNIAAQLGLDTIIEQLPQGYDTVISGQTTDVLPCGIRQRISIARALITKKAIVIFDEANSDVDIKGDEYIKSTLMQLVGQCTLIIISHRPSILNIADEQCRYRIADGRLELAS